MWFRVSERHFAVECTCGTRHTADMLPTRLAGGVTLYDCASCGTCLIGIAVDDRPPVPGAAPTGAPDDADGHRMCGFVFGSTVDMTLWPPGAVESFVDIPARPAFFSARGCA